MSKYGNPYGSQYRSLASSGNIKIVQKREGATETLMETMTRGRVYGEVGKDGKLKRIVYFDNKNKRAKQIDLTHGHGKIKGPHTHHGYRHNEKDTPKGAARLTSEERKMVERVMELWENAH